MEAADFGGGSFLKIQIDGGGSPGIFSAQRSRKILGRPAICRRRAQRRSWEIGPKGPLWESDWLCQSQRLTTQGNSNWKQSTHRTEPTSTHTKWKFLKLSSWMWSWLDDYF